MKNNIKAQHWILKWMDDNPNHTKKEALIALEKAKQMEEYGTMETKQTVVEWGKNKLLKIQTFISKVIL